MDTIYSFETFVTAYKTTLCLICLYKQHPLFTHFDPEDEGTVLLRNVIFSYETAQCHICLCNSTATSFHLFRPWGWIQHVRNVGNHLQDYTVSHLSINSILTLPTSILKMEVECYSKMLVSTHKTARCHIPRRPQSQQSPPWRFQNLVTKICTWSIGHVTDRRERPATSPPRMLGG
jgi:hypothetical protein